MPRFSEQEKMLIQDKLLAEGERLFTAFGLKKVTIDELAAATAISKGSFYAFYPSKEELFMDISGRLQQKMWGGLKTFLDENRHLPPKELMKQCFHWMFAQMLQYPMLLMMDRELTEQLYRKLSPEVIAAHTHEDEDSLHILEEYGIRFKVRSDLVATTLQVLALNLISLQHDNAITAPEVMDIMISGVINELVE